MPNWCYNRVTAYGNEDKLKEIEKIFESKTPFNDIFPMPDWKTIPNEKGELPVLHQEFNKNGDLFYETYNFPDGKNDDRWYHWCIQNCWALNNLPLMGTASNNKGRVDNLDHQSLLHHCQSYHNFRNMPFNSTLQFHNLVHHRNIEM